MATTTCVEKQNNAFNALMLRWLSFMEKTFPEDACFSNLVRLMSGQCEDNKSSPMFYFFNNNYLLQHMIRACNNEYYNAQPDEKSEEMMGALNIALPHNFKAKVDALPQEEQTKIWHFMNELLTIALRVHPEHIAENLPPSPFDRERYPYKLFSTY